MTTEIGHGRAEWPVVIAKELTDNALDACEEAAVAPRIVIKVDSEGITVADNGPGLPPETVAKLLDYSRRTSSREAYIAPTRGQQGNALQTLFAIAYVLDGTTGRVDITAHGQRHEIGFRVNIIRQEPAVVCETHPEKVKKGTKIKLWWPAGSKLTLTDAKPRFLQIVEGYRFLNPHLSIDLDWFGERRRTRATARTWNKWLPSEPTSPHWYGQAHFERLLSAYISYDQDRGADRLVREVVREFRGLTGTAKQKEVLNATGLARMPLSALVNCDGLRHDLTGPLLTALQQNSNPVKPAALGVIGREHIAARLADIGADPDTLEYRKHLHEDANGLPYVLEVAFAALADEDQPRRIVAGTNWSPGLVNPFSTLNGSGYGDGLDALLEECRAGEDEPIAFFVHLAQPRTQYTNRGKSMVAIPRDVADEITRLVTKVTAKWSKIRRDEEREASRVWRRRELLTRQKGDKQPLQDAVFSVMEQAARDTSGDGRIVFPIRNLYYSVRPLLGELACKLKWPWFQKVVGKYEREHGLIPLMYRDPRGFLIEPHTGNIIPLGTREVDRYEFPEYLYDKIMYVEKKGFLSTFKYAGIAEKYDLAVVCAEGYATRAAKTLLSAGQEQRDMTLLCLHDADPYGYNIARTLQEATEACPNHNISVIDLGLELQEALDLGLDTEPFIRKKALPAALEFNEIEEAYFTGEEKWQDGKRVWQCQRIELNALAKNPDEFIAWIVAKLKRHGLTKKLVPPRDRIAQQSELRRQEIVTNRVATCISAIIGMDGMVDAVTKAMLPNIKIDNIPDEVVEWAAQLRPESWEHCVDRVIEGRADAIGDQIQRAAEDILRRTLQGRGRGKL
ncbi:MAG: hypothetical protein KKA28_02890 [Planctomycetes bacterium]|nr:hypothetical protein [Planctomycetota bacterium]MCG2684806.1 hypothetical protein [Planctomycetales bacterium]